MNGRTLSIEPGFILGFEPAARIKLTEAGIRFVLIRTVILPGAPTRRLKSGDELHQQLPAWLNIQVPAQHTQAQGRKKMSAVRVFRFSSATLPGEKTSSTVIRCILEQLYLYSTYMFIS